MFVWKPAQPKQKLPIAQIALGKADLFALVFSPFLGDKEYATSGIVDIFVTVGKKYVRYWEVKRRVITRQLRSMRGPAQMVPARQSVTGALLTHYAEGHTVVLSQRKGSKRRNTGGKSADEKAFHEVQFLTNGTYLVGGHSGNIYLCQKSRGLAKFETCHEGPLGTITSSTTTPRRTSRP